MRLNIDMVYDFIPKDVKDCCKRNRVHIEVVIIVNEPMYVSRGMLDIKINSVYVAKMNEEVVVNFRVTDDQNYINSQEDWSFEELKHPVFSGFPCKIYYK